MHPRFVVATLSLVLAWGIRQAAVQGQGADLVFPHKGAPSRGTITEMGINQVTLDVSGTPKPIEVKDIARITFANEPPELSNARTAALQKNYTLALQELRKLNAEKVERDLIKHDVDFYRAVSQARLAMAEGGDRAAAITTLYNFVREAKQSYHFYEAAELLGDLSVSIGKYADAVKYYGPIARAPWRDYQMRANNAVGRALLADKQFEPALAKFEAVLAGGLATPEAAEQKSLATVGKSVCLAEAGKADEGIAALLEIVDSGDSKDAALFGRAYNALGRCYLKANRPKDAVLAFLHTDLMYAADAEAHAEALFFLSKHWPDANKSAVVRNTLRERYAGSVWASQQ